MRFFSSEALSALCYFNFNKIKLVNEHKNSKTIYVFFMIIHI